MHPAGQDDKLGSRIAILDFRRQSRIVLFSCFLDFLSIFFGLRQKAVRNQVEVFVWYATLFGSLNGICLAPVHDQASDSRIGYLAASTGIIKGLKVGPIAAGHYPNATCWSHSWYRQEDSLKVDYGSEGPASGIIGANAKCFGRSAESGRSARTGTLSNALFLL